ncbi:S8 family serine peptidase [Gammaproteobacteria bacterium]|nr:S8 family serine peptidase [Gammaproteobacteria bacterium]
MIDITQRLSRALGQAAIVLVLVGCGGGGGGGGGSSSTTPTVTPPDPTLSASSPGGLFNQPQQVTLTSNGAPIYYTTDGSAPTSSSQRYTAAFTLDNDTTLQAVAINSAGQRSSTVMLSFRFDFDPPTNFALEANTLVINTANESAFTLTIANGELDASYSIEINDADGLTQAIGLSGQINNADEQVLSADLSSMADGDVTAVLSLTDVAGNASVPFSLALTKATDTAGVQVVGAVNVSSGTQIDSDVNESSVTNIANNDFASAQQIFSPGVLGGYVNQANSGVSGSLFESGDEDYFRVSLSAGDRILLTIGDTGDGQDLDVELYDAAEVLVDDSVGTGNTESVQAPEAGDYFIRVFAFSGASNYVVTMGSSSAASVDSTTGSDFSSFDDFVPSQVIVQLGEKADAVMSEMRQSMQVVKGQRLDEPLLMVFDGAEARKSAIVRVNESLNDLPNVGISAKQRTKQETIWAIKAMMRRPGIERAEPNYSRDALATPNDSLYAEQWHFPQIQLPAAWDLTTGSPNVRVAVIDTGILSNHPDFAGQLVDGVDMIGDGENAGDGDGVDSNPEDEGDGDLGDGSSSFHGTHVAGTVAAATNNSVGVAGVAWDSRIMPVRALGRSGGTSFDIIHSIRYAAGLSNASGDLPTQPADVINLSLGGAGSSQSEADAVTAARNSGVIVIAAAGNSGTQDLEYPASYEGVVSVSATNQTNVLTGYSNFGPTVDVAAPGGNMSEDVNTDGFPDGVLSAIGSDRDNSLTYGYRRYEGTSMAAPHVAGVAALMKAVYPDLTPATLDQMLMEGRITDDLGAAGRDNQFGHGLINAFKAVMTAQELASGTLQPLPPSLLASPGAISFGVINTQLVLSLTNAGGGDLSVTGVSDDTDWLNVSALSTNDVGLGSYRVTADRTGVAAGEYTATIRISSSVGDLSVPVRLQVSATTFSSSAGVLFALLIDSESDETSYQQRLANPADGVYELDLSDVAPGTYALVVGSDMDNDNFICDAGEACGAYPTLNDEAPIEISEDSIYALGISFDQGRFFSSSATDESESAVFKGFRYKDAPKTVD